MESKDLFADKADEWDSNPVPAQISAGVGAAIEQHVALDENLTVLDFGAGTGLVATRIAPRVNKVIAVDVSAAMLAKLAAKTELAGKVEVRGQDILQTPLGEQVDLVVSAMAMHHVEDTRALLRTWFEHLRPGGRIAVADLDTEAGTFHPPGMEGLYHFGFDRDELAAMAVEAGFVEPAFVTATEVVKEDHRYPVFLFMARRP